MSNVVSSLVSYVRGVLSTIARVLKGLIKQAWPLVVVALIIYFSPALLNWASAANAPPWLVTIFEKAFSVQAAMSAWLATTWAAFLAWFTELSFAYQALLVFGIGYVLNPEGALELTRSIVDVLGKVTDPLLEPVTGGLGLKGLLLGVGAIFLLTRRAS